MVMRPQVRKFRFHPRLAQWIPTRERTIVDRLREGGVRDPEALAKQVEQSFEDLMTGEPFISLDESDRMIRDAS